ncbi:TetR/AcrR family transcriptional regulator [Rhodococcus zopfii]|uniref:TetR/AcrR family transcriptional regulator n=1 Tax=Rhodococcus zopfii TaxID=43772 RepID=UPI001F0D2E07|nr:TetR/AcrR family transcriptional regulator [Rhodococcus zopfii]
MSTRPPLGRPVGASGEETRQRILAATMRSVAEVGYARATIREIARTAGITSGSLYHYFPNKSELIKATFGELADIAVPRLADAATDADGVVGKLMALFDEGGKVTREYPYAVAFDRAIRVESAEHLHLGEDADTLFATLRAVVVGIVDGARQDGELDPDVDVDGAANAIFAILRGMYELAATASAAQYDATLDAVKRLIQGTLFEPSHRV